MAEAFARAAGARAPMPSLMDAAMGWESAQSPGSSGPPAGGESHNEAVLNEATTLPRTPTRAAGGTLLIDPPRVTSSDPPAPAYGQPPPPARRTSDPMYHGAPSGGSPSGAPPSAEVPLSSLKGTQPLNRSDIDNAQQRMRTVRLPKPERGGMGQAGSAPSDPPPWEPVAGPGGGGAPSNPGHAGSGSYGRPAMGSAPPGGSAPPPNPRAMGSGSYPHAPAAGLDMAPRGATPPPSSGSETVAGGYAMQRSGGTRSKGIWVLGGLLLGTGVGVLIAVIVILIRS
jgi:hypothetical protein